VKILAKIRNRRGETITIIRYHKSLQERVMDLFREGYPISFDGADLRKIKKSVRGKTDKTFLLAFHEEELVGCLTGLEKAEGPHNVYVMDYLYVKKDFRNKDVATILLGIEEEILKSKARLIIGINTGILPDYDLSFGWFKKMEFVVLGVVKYWFRSDLPGVFMGKVNPHIPLGKEIPKNSGWDETIADSISGKRISEQEYNSIINDPGQTPKGKWGLDLIGRRHVIECHI